MNRLVKAALLGSTAFALAVSAMGNGVAEAADNAAKAADSSGIEEVVVTARMRSESLQSVPVSVSAFTEKNIRDAGIQRAADFIGLTPNVSIAESQQPGVNFITIRGISQVRNGESPVAVVVDGVLQSTTFQFNSDMFDLQQIEVLKGPQGALYGRNAIGGAIVITTKEPTNEFDGKITAGTGNGGQVKAQLGASGPIIKDKLFASVSGSHKSREGYLTNVFLRNKVDHYRGQAARGRFILKATDDFKADFRLSYDRTYAGALYFTRNNVNGAGNYTYYPSVHSTSSHPGTPDDYGPPLNSNVDGDALRKIFSTSLKLDLETPIGTLTSVSSYDSVSEWDKGDASPYTSGIAKVQSSDFVFHAKSQELRLTSKGDQKFRYIFGGYYLDLHRVAQRNNGWDRGAGITLLGYNDRNSDNPSTSNTADDNHQKAYSFFSQLNYDITDQLEIAGAIRYDHDKRDTKNIGKVADANSLTIGYNGSPYRYAPVGTPGAYREAAFDAWQPKATLRFKIDEGSSVYGSFSKGFRSGGFNQDGVHDPITGKDDFFKEMSETYEAGWKSQFMDRKITINGAAFFTKFKNSQYFVFIPAASAQIISNIDKSEMKGVEVDFNFRPVKGWDLFGNLGYTDSEIKAYAASPASVGKYMPYVPKLGFNLGTQYVYPVSDKLQVTGRLEMHHKGSQYYETLNTAGARSAFNLFDARLAVGDQEDKWRLTAWTKNAFNKKYNAEFVGGGFTYPAEPRTFGLDFDYRF
jgi:iron complex outermembrane receptor protein